MSSVVALALEPVVSLLFPTRCVLCSARHPQALCDACCYQIAGFGGPICACCAHPLPHARAACADCARLGTPAFERVIAVGPYQTALKDAVLALKYHDGWRIADVLGRLMAERLRACPMDFGAPNGRSAQIAFDAVVAVPIDAARRAARGYSQSELLASRVAVRLALPHRRNVLVRRVHGVVQSTADLSLRHAQVDDIFEARGRLDGQHILLVDDVMTTAATMHAAARALRQQGARVTAAVAARQALRQEGPR